ncbi:hypothetical protein D3C85_249470 [compost metagenome]
MSYMNLSVEDFLAAINTANSTAFTAADVVIGTPQVVEGTWQGQVTTHNTALRLTAKAGGQYQGTKVLTFDRLKLNELTAAHIPGFRISAYNKDSVHDLIPMIAYWTGIHFTTDDLIDNPLTDNGDNTWTAILSAKPGSIGWIGNVSVIVKKGSAPINEMVQVTSLPGLNYPTPLDTDTYGQLYLYGYDFTSYFTQVQALAPGVINSTQADELVTMLKAVDISAGKALWTNTPGGTAWNLSGATVVSNGLNSVSLPTNPAYKYVLALQLDPAVLTPAGVMYLHYNDPFDPNAT